MTAMPTLDELTRQYLDAAERHDWDAVQRATRAMLPRLRAGERPGARMTAKVNVLLDRTMKEGERARVARQERP